MFRLFDLSALVVLQRLYQTGGAFSRKEVQDPSTSYSFSAVPHSAQFSHLVVLTASPLQLSSPYSPYSHNKYKVSVRPEICLHRARNLCLVSLLSTVVVKLYSCTLGTTQR